MGLALLAIWLGAVAPTSIPSDAVALIGSRPVPKAEFDHGFAIAAARLDGAPAPGSQEELRVRGVVMEGLLSSAWIELEAAERGIKVSERTVRREFLRAKRETFRTEAAFRRYLRETGQTEADILKLVRTDLLSQRLRRDATAKARTRKGRQRLLERFVRRFDRRWRAKTVCGEGYTIRRCSRTVPIAPPP